MGSQPGTGGWATGRGRLTPLAAAGPATGPFVSLHFCSKFVVRVLRTRTSYTSCAFRAVRVMFVWFL